MHIQNELEQTIQSLAVFFEKNSCEENKAFIAELNRQFAENEEIYESELQLAFLHFSHFAALPWLAKHPDVANGWEKKHIESIYNGLLPHFVRTVIEKKEGTICSGDKEHFVIRKMKEAIATGTNLSLYQTYDGCERIEKEKWSQQAYWSPKSFRDTDDVKAKFRAWYNLENGGTEDETEK